MEVNPTILTKSINKVIQEVEEFNVKENRRCNVSVLMNYHQD